MGTLAEHLDGLIIKSPSTCQGLTVFPVCLISGEFEKSGEDFLTVGEGLKSGGIRVYETGEMDRVEIENRNGCRAVALDGETLLGGAQNRMITSGSVIESGRRENVPTSCVEVHRWDAKSGDRGGIPAEKKYFTGSEAVFGSLKRLKMKETLPALRSDRRSELDQKKVWQHIVDNFGVCGAASKTLDLHDMYEFWEAPLRAFSTRFTVLPNQVGMISFLDRKTWFADIFLNNDLLFRNFRKLVRAYAFDALIRLEKGLRAPSKKPGMDEAKAVFRGLKSASLHQMKAASGEYRHSHFFSTARFCGTAVIHDGRAVQIAACSM